MTSKKEDKFKLAVKELHRIWGKYGDKPSRKYTLIKGNIVTLHDDEDHVLSNFIVKDGKAEYTDKHTALPDRPKDWKGIWIIERGTAHPDSPFIKGGFYFTPRRLSDPAPGSGKKEGENK